MILLKQLEFLMYCLTVQNSLQDGETNDSHFLRNVEDAENTLRRRNETSGMIVCSQKNIN